MSKKQLSGSDLRTTIMNKTKGETIETFLEGTNKVSPPWKLGRKEEVVWRKKQISIKRLAHTTHRPSYQATCIRGRRSNTQTPSADSSFKFSKVCGKNKRSPKSDQPCCTYRQSPGTTVFQKVPPDQELLPGYYSWWEVDFDDDTRRKLITEIIESFGVAGCSTSDDPKPPLDKKPLHDLLQTAHQQQLDLPMYIQGKGYHGPHKFSASLSTLIQRYQEARKEGGECRVVLRFAGTIRYKYQVSSVVIVCCDLDYDLQDYEILDQIPRFHTEKILDESRCVQQSGEDLHIGFDSDSITAKSSKDYCRSFWHQAVFAFYSPTEDLRFRVTEGDDGEWKKVWHPMCATCGPDCKKM